MIRKTSSENCLCCAFLVSAVFPSGGLPVSLCTPSIVTTMEAIGTLAAIVGIIDVTTRTISALTDIRTRFITANDNLDILLTHLITVRAALRQIHALIEEQSITSQDHNYQLVMDLDVAIKGCGLLVSWIDGQIANVEYDADNSLKFPSKLKLLLNSKATDDCLVRLDRQLNALNLLFTTFRWLVNLNPTP